jgi:hypothetical protein
VPPAQPRRASSESAELAQLRLDEDQLFPAGRSSSSESGWQPPLLLRDAACGQESSLDGRRCVGSRPDWLADLRMPDLPVRPDEDVRRYVRYFTETHHGRKIFTTWLKRSGRYREIVSEALRERQLPQDLHALVFVESGYSPAAVSSASAVGLWQFMPATGKAYGLTVEPDYDERRSIKKASAAGARHLADLYERFGSWDFALAAYNMGYQGLLTRMQELGTEDFWELAATEGALPRESALYVPKILAVALVLRNLDRFGFDDVRVDPALPTVDLDVPPGTSLAVVARASGTSLQKLRELNPELLRSTAPAKGRAQLHIPASGLARARVMLPQLVDPLDRDGLEQRVSPTFDWGKDELPRRSGAGPTAPGAEPDEVAEARAATARPAPAKKGTRQKTRKAVISREHEPAAREPDAPRARKAKG